MTDSTRIDNILERFPQIKRNAIIPLLQALQDEFGRRPTMQEIERFSRAARVLYKAVLGLHFERQYQKRKRQLVMF